MVIEERSGARKFPRSHPRISVNFPVRVIATDTTGSLRRVNGSIINLSRGGAAIEVNFETSTEQQVTIHWQDREGSHTMPALLRWKQPEDRQWKIGVEITGDRQLWSSLIYVACQYKKS